MTLSDLESRWAAGWSDGRNRNRGLVLQCWRRAKERIVKLGGRIPGIVVRHNQYPVFTSHAWAQAINDRRWCGDLFSPRMEAQGNPWIESLWGRMKVESESLIHQAQTLEELQQTIDARFEYYNRRRRHSSIGYKRPQEYAKERLNTEENIDPDS